MEETMRADAGSFRRWEAAAEVVTNRGTNAMDACW
jgi:hypothetical protein